MIIPHRMLSPDALRGVIEAFVTREGTDYGAQEVPLATKVLQVQQQLEVGTAVIVYDEDTESCTIQPTRTRERTIPERQRLCRRPSGRGKRVQGDIAEPGTAHFYLFEGTIAEIL